ncbi:MAG: hypothetical protein ACOCUU_00130 [Nanoarchaeota archaeon]
MEKEDNLDNLPHLENIGKKISELFGKSKQENFKSIISESPQIGVLQITIDEKRVSEIREFSRVIKRYYVESGFMINELEDDESQESFEVSKQNLKYIISIEYSSKERVLTISISDLDKEDFNLFG